MGLVLRQRRRPQCAVFLLPSACPQQRRSLVNVKLKWVKDRALDSVVARERHLRPAVDLVNRLATGPRGGAPGDLHTRSRSQLGLAEIAGVTAFMRRHPALFTESRLGGDRWFGLTSEALRLRREEEVILRETKSDLVDRLRKLLMLTAEKALPIPTVDQLRWDMGLPLGYQDSLIPCYPSYFEIVEFSGDQRLWLRLLACDDRLAVSHLQKNSGGGENQNLAFPLRFTRGFGLKKKCTAWLEEWQRLPYTSPYADASGLDPRTDVSEKRIVGVFHELLHLTIGKKTERKNVSNLRKPLGLPQKFTKVFGRHPGIFYLSQKLATQTVVLREAYGGGRMLLQKHPLVGIRERYAELMRVGMLETGDSVFKDPEDGQDSDAIDDGDASSTGCDKESEEIILNWT